MRWHQLEEIRINIAVVVLLDVPESRHEPGDLWTTGSSCSSLDTLHEGVVYPDGGRVNMNHFCRVYTDDYR